MTLLPVPPPKIFKIRTKRTIETIDYCFSKYWPTVLHLNKIQNDTSILKISDELSHDPYIYCFVMKPGFISFWINFTSIIQFVFVDNMGKSVQSSVFRGYWNCLCQQNYLHAGNVPEDPMQDVNATVSFMDKYLDALITAVTMQHFGMMKCDDDPFTDQAAFLKPEDERAKEILQQIADYAFPEVFALEDDPFFYCPSCSKKYKRFSSLRDHQQRSCKKKDKTAASLKSPGAYDNEDGTLNYSCTSLALFLLAQNFTDARQHGDGERIVRLMKFMLPLFRLTGKTKYCYYVFHHLAQVHCLLPGKYAHDVKWNRFVNNKGKIETNIEVDREVEHQNRTFKGNCKSFMGKITDKAILRSSNSYQQVAEILTVFDKQVQVKQPSGRHTVPSHESDVKDFSQVFLKAEIFRNMPGRYHKEFPGFPRHILQKLDVLQFKQWMLDKMKESKKYSIYQDFIHKKL